MNTPLEAARALHAALESGLHGEALRPYFTPDATVLEHPNDIKPKGAIGSVENMIAESTRGAGLLSSQTYAVREAIEHAPETEALGLARDLAILRLTWTGIIARDLGPFRAGQVLTAHIAQFIHVRHGRVASIETFDCYEPFQ